MSVHVKRFDRSGHSVELHLGFDSALQLQALDRGGVVVTLTEMEGIAIAAALQSGLERSRTRRRATVL